MPRPHNGRSVFIIVRTYAFAFGIWLTSDRLTSIPRHGSAAPRTASLGRSPGYPRYLPPPRWHRAADGRPAARRRGRSFRSPGSAPGVQLQLQQTPVLGGADILALDHLQVVRDARQQEDIRQTRVDTAVGGGVGGIVQRRFLRGVGREEAGVIAIFVVRQRDKAGLANSNSRVSGIITSEGIFTVAGAQIVQMDGQIFHRAAGLRTANLHAPAVVNKALHHIGCEGERRAGPEIFS